MIDKDPCNPERSAFVEGLIRDIKNIEDYKRFGITRENVGVIVTFIINRFYQERHEFGLERIDEILTYRFNEKRFLIK